MSSIGSPSLIEALSDLREIRQRVLVHTMFPGFSGYARAVGGIVALSGSIALMVLDRYGSPPIAGVVVWGIVCVIAAGINFGALLFWWRSHGSDREIFQPVSRLIGPLTVAAGLTAVILSRAMYDLLFPLWMTLFGLVHLSVRDCMPQSMAKVGWYYIACGGIAAYLFTFADHWFMGVVFFCGETYGGYLLTKIRASEGSYE